MSKKKPENWELILELLTRAEAAVEAYKDRFTVAVRGVVGPIDGEMKALEKALDKLKET